MLSVAFGLATVWALAASWYILFHDELLARFVSDQRSMEVAYESRLGALQLQLDRASSERLLDRDGIKGRLLALGEHQGLIERRQAILADLADLTASPADTTSSITAPAYVAPAMPQKPFPPTEVPELRTRDGDRTDASYPRIAPELAALEMRADGTARQQLRIVHAIAETATRKVDRLRSAISHIGLEPSRFDRTLQGKTERGLGGPFVPATGDAFDLALAEAKRLGGVEDKLRQVVATLPFRRPLDHDFTFTSGFGTRLDPFTGGLAMHTGLDMRADFGAPARATAAGRITAAEYAGGYGNLVEIDHGFGVVTRYAHLAGDTVRIGQWVEAGAIVGRVGSTGRSTGNHLHYETRIDGEPVDPQRFLKAGTMLDESALRLSPRSTGDRIR